MRTSCVADGTALPIGYRCLTGCIFSVILIRNGFLVVGISRGLDVSDLGIGKLVGAILITIELSAATGIICLVAPSGAIGRVFVNLCYVVCTNMSCQSKVTRINVLGAFIKLELIFRRLEVIVK